MTFMFSWWQVRNSPVKSVSKVIQQHLLEEKEPAKLKWMKAWIWVSARLRYHWNTFSVWDYYYSEKKFWDYQIQCSNSSQSFLHEKKVLRNVKSPGIFFLKGYILSFSSIQWCHGGGVHIIGIWVMVSPCSCWVQRCFKIDKLLHIEGGGGEMLLQFNRSTMNSVCNIYIVIP